MIEIKITDPHLLADKTLIATAKYLMQLAGHDVVESARPAPMAVPAVPPLLAPVVASAPVPVPVGVTADTESDGQPIAPTFTGFAPPPAPAAPTAPAPAPVASQVFGGSPAPAAPTAPAGVELDCKGLPWDGRIHSRTKSKIADGSWKVQRGLDPLRLLEIENELRQAMSAPSVPAPVMSVPVASVSVPPLIEEEYIPTSDIKDFPYLMNIITPAVTLGKITHAQVVEIVNKYGIPSVPLAATRPDLVPAIIADIESLI